MPRSSTKATARSEIRLRRILDEAYVGVILLGCSLILGTVLVEGAFWLFEYVNSIGLND